MSYSGSEEIKPSNRRSTFAALFRSAASRKKEGTREIARRDDEDSVVESQPESVEAQRPRRSRVALTQQGRRSLARRSLTRAKRPGRKDKTEGSDGGSTDSKPSVRKGSKGGGGGLKAAFKLLARKQRERESQLEVEVRNVTAIRSPKRKSNDRKNNDQIRDDRDDELSSYSGSKSSRTEDASEVDSDLLRTNSVAKGAAELEVETPSRRRREESDLKAKLALAKANSAEQLDDDDERGESDGDPDAEEDLPPCDECFQHAEACCASLCGPDGNSEMCLFDGCTALAHPRLGKGAVGYWDWWYLSNRAISQLMCCLCIHNQNEKRVRRSIRDGTAWYHPVGEFEGELLQQAMNKIHKDSILSIYLDKAILVPDIGLRQPMVRVHVLNLTNGHYITKSRRERKIVSAYERPTDTIPPIISRSFDLIATGGFEAEWKQELKINEKTVHLCKPTTMFFFEILDLDINDVAENQMHNGIRFKGGFAHVAWGFLKLVSTRGDLHIGKSLELQLMRYSRGAHRYEQDQIDAPDIYYEWLYQRNFGYEKYPSTLDLKLTTTKPLKTSYAVGRRPMLPSEIEKGRIGVREMVQQSMKEAEQSAARQIAVSENLDRAMGRHRDRKEACRIPASVSSEIRCDQGCQSLAFSPDGKHLAAACSHEVMQDKIIVAIKVFKTDTADLVHTFIGHHDVVFDLSWSSDSVEILSSSADQTARTFSMKRRYENGMHIREVKHALSLQHTARVLTAQFHPVANSPRLMITGAEDSNIRVWSGKDGALLALLQAHSASVNSISFEPRGRRFYSADSSGSVKKWVDRGLSDPNFDRRDQMAWATRFVNENVENVQLEGVPINCIKYHARPERLVVYGRTSCLYLLALVRHKLKKEFKGVRCTNSRLKFDISPDGTYLIAGSEDGKAYIWDILRGKLVRTLETGFTSPLSDVVWHPSEHLIAVCSFGKGSPIILMDNREKPRQQ